MELPRFVIEVTFDQWLMITPHGGHRYCCDRAGSVYGEPGAAVG